MIFRILCIVMLMLPSAAGMAATILVFGDSLSSGYGVPQGAGWVALLQRRLHEEKLDYKVVNASISGETTLGGKNRIAAALAMHQPAIVILALGANDGLRGQSLDAMQSNLESMIATCRKRNARVLLVGMRLPPNYGAAYTEKFRRVFDEIARHRGLPRVPFLLEGFAEAPGLFQPDGIHPTAQAQPIILNNVWQPLRPMLRK